MSDSATPWTVAYQAPPSMGFSRQEYWSGLPLPSLLRNATNNQTLEEEEKLPTNLKSYNMFSENNEIELEINNRNIKGKFSNLWKLNTTLLKYGEE